MRRIAVINQKGGVGKTTTCTNLGAALARLGRRVLLVDMDPQANLTMHLGVESLPETPSTYTVLLGETPIAEAVRETETEGLYLLPSNIDLSGAELELASAIGRETILRDAVDEWETDPDAVPFDYIIFDCAPSLGLLTVNGLTAAKEVIITLQTEFFALQGMSKLIEVVGLLQKRLNPGLQITGILPCLYDSRLKLAREVLAEIRNYFPDKVLPYPIRTNVKLAEAPSYGMTIFQYAADSNGAEDHLRLARAIVAQEAELAPQVAERHADSDAEADRLAEEASKKKLGASDTTRAPAGLSGEGRSSFGDSAGASDAEASDSTKTENRSVPGSLTTRSTMGDEAETGDALDPAPDPAAGAEAARASEEAAAPGAGTIRMVSGALAPGGEGSGEITRILTPTPRRQPPRVHAPNWDSPEVGDVELEPRPRTSREARSSADRDEGPDELPPLPPDAFEMTGYPSL